MKNFSNWHLSRLIAKVRQDMHVNVGNSTKRFYKDQYIEEQIGIFGELEFGKKYNFYVDLENKAKGDDTDFLTPIGTIDVKTARKPYNLLVKEWEIGKSDNYVLAKFNEDSLSVEFLGWERDSTMSTMPKKDFGYRIINYYEPADNLRSMIELEELLGIRNEEDIDIPSWSD